MRKLLVLASAAALALATGCSKNKSTSGSSSGSASAGTNAGSGSTAGTGSGSSGTSASSGTTASSGTSASSGTTSGSSGTSGNNDAGQTSLDAGLLEYCAGHGAPVNVGDSLTDGGSSATCAGNLAQRTFRFALCTCDALTVNHQIATDSFLMEDAGFPDGGHGLIQVVRNNAAVGVDNGIATNGSSAKLLVGGSLFDSDGGITATGEVNVAGELHAGTAADSSSSPNSQVGLDAFCQADCTGNWAIAGNLYQPNCPASGPTVGGTCNTTTTLDIADPCDCNNLVDIAGIVAAHQNNNDNANIGLVEPDAGFGDGGLDPATFANNGPATFDFPCGRYYLSGVSITSGTTWNIQGRTAIMVGGDFTIAGSGGGMTINVPPGSELDLFIQGNLAIGSPSTIGSADNVSGTRIYVGGSQAISLTTPVNIYANIYAPLAVFETDHPTDIYGALFVKALINNPGGGASGGNVSIHYDESVLAAGSECITPAVDAGFVAVDAGFYDDGGVIDGGFVAVDAGPQQTGCNTCLDCNNQACNVPSDGGAGVCGACTTSADCCSPLTCQGGTCQVVFQ